MCVEDQRAGEWEGDTQPLRVLHTGWEHGPVAGPGDDGLRGLIPEGPLPRSDWTQDESPGAESLLWLPRRCGHGQVTQPLES